MLWSELDYFHQRVLRTVASCRGQWRKSNFEVLGLDSNMKFGHTSYTDRSVPNPGAWHPCRCGVPILVSECFPYCWSSIRIVGGASCVYGHVLFSISFGTRVPIRHVWLIASPRTLAAACAYIVVRSSNYWCTKLYILATTVGWRERERERERGKEKNIYTSREIVRREYNVEVNFVGSRSIDGRARTLAFLWPISSHVSPFVREGS
jgi:hypothetical protein